jgi:hypothetical protein
METIHTPKDREFLLMEGGPLYRIQRRLGLIRANATLVLQRAILSILLTWFVLLVLSIIDHRAIGHTVAVPFLRDFGAYTRFLISVPLLIIAENILGPRFAQAASYFVNSGLVTPKDYDAFDEAVEDGLHWRDSVLAEIIIAVLAYSLTFTGRQYAVHSSTWTHSESGVPTLAGWWFFVFCGPLLNFLMLRWFWRLFLWGRFLRHMSKLDLQLFPPHPDEAGGLGFVGRVQQFFGVILFAYSAGMAGIIANGAIYDKIPLQQFAPTVAAYVIFVVILILIPVAVFYPRMHHTRLNGMYQYGALATAYTSSFHHKWINGENPEGEKLLGTADMQSLADLGNSFGFVAKMDHLPMNPRTPIHLVLACLIPMAPLVLIVMPLKDVLRLLMKAVL